MCFNFFKELLILNKLVTIILISYRMKSFILLLLISFITGKSQTFEMNADGSRNGKLPGFVASPYFHEQVCMFNYQPEIRVMVNAASENSFNPVLPTEIILYALPNGNTIEKTIGKKLSEGDDWHYDIQHIGAQTRFLRSIIKDKNIVIVYLETEQKSWPAWKRKRSDYPVTLDSLLNYLTMLFHDNNPSIVLSGHSGGGSFIFGLLDRWDTIPSVIKRITFLDSNYGYTHLYGPKLLRWLNASSENCLCVLAYNDSVALYNQKPVVSDTGGTWHRSKMMKDFLSDHLYLVQVEDNEFIRYSGLNNRIKFILKKNPGREILHTVQVELNGFIHSMLIGTKLESVDYKYYGERAYNNFIQASRVYPSILRIPPRPLNAMSGSEFMQSIKEFEFDKREEEIFNQITSGNIPEFLRQTKKITGSFLDAEGKIHTCTYEVMPDYLAIGSDEDYCRIPMGPITVQRIADLFGAILPTSKLVDDIYLKSEIKLSPVAYKPIGDNNTLVSKFIEHSGMIDLQLDSANYHTGQLISGIKKDVILSSKIFNSDKKNRVVIYGWHKLDGKPIQPVSSVHINSYVDYSHGIRLLNNEIMIDDKLMLIESVLTDPVLFKLLSDEEQPLKQTSYLPEE